MEIERVERQGVFSHEAPTMVSFRDRRPQELHAKKFIVDFIIKINEMHLRMMSPEEIKDFIRAALPPQYRNAEYSIHKLYNDPYPDVQIVYGLTLHSYDKNCYSPSEMKKWIYCPSCGAQLKNTHCEYCGMEL